MQVKNLGWPLLCLLVAGYALAAALLPSGGHSADSAAMPEAPPGTIHRIDVLLGGIPQHGNALGDPRAPVTLQFFGDLQCREVRLFTLGALPPLIRRYVRGGRLRIVYRSLQSDTYSASEFWRQQVAALAAGRQNKAWYFIELFYHEQKGLHTHYASNRYLRALARQVSGLGMTLWNVDRFDEELARQVTSDELVVNRQNIPQLTPVFFIGPTGGPSSQILGFSLLEPLVFEEAIERVLKEAPRKSHGEEGRT